MLFKLWPLGFHLPIKLVYYIVKTIQYSAQIQESTLQPLVTMVRFMNIVTITFILCIFSEVKCGSLKNNFLSPLPWFVCMIPPYCEMASAINNGRLAVHRKA